MAAHDLTLFVNSLGHTFEKDYFSANAKPALPGATTETNTNGTGPVFKAPCTCPGFAMAISPAFR
ncbi:protein of unknown function [Denitratisoma oestradiolicum]|uniref:Uncharacterized protein n=1 Tax=Denitratisoma oestradiolicum TaxID=311182 RepID=A0A6S6XT27_9PROT|nr:protein of unknown function [Denitratisoma oestradiolicum]